MPLAQLWWQFIKIGVAAFGGLGVTLSLLERYLVTDRRVLTAQDVTEVSVETQLSQNGVDYMPVEQVWTESPCRLHRKSFARAA